MDAGETEKMTIERIVADRLSGKPRTHAHLFVMCPSCRQYYCFECEYGYSGLWQLVNIPKCITCGLREIAIFNELREAGRDRTRPMEE